VPRAARPILLAVAGLVLAAGALALVVLAFSSRDDAAVTAPQGPGRAFPDRGARHVTPAQRGSVRYDTEPPVSGPHVPVPVTRDARVLSDDQILHALELGNVILVYGAPRPPAPLRALADEVAGPFDPALAQEGQAVVLARRPGTRGVLALAWARLLRAPGPADPQLRAFADAWLGRGARR
jgi:uncharacterized protein DUF3105